MSNYKKYEKRQLAAASLNSMPHKSEFTKKRTTARYLPRQSVYSQYAGVTHVTGYCSEQRAVL